MKRSVCIAGAGPAGLVAAKTLLQTAAFDVTIYDKKNRLAGIWALDEDTTDGFLSPNTPTNLSQFTVCFSDHSWDRVDASSRRDAANGNASIGRRDRRKVPTFPKAWQVHRYLKSYRDKHIPEEVFFLGWEVIRSERIEESSVSAPKWDITVRDTHGREETKRFDLLVVASGFFSEPRTPQQDVSGLAAETAALPVKVIHSSQFRSLHDIFEGGQDVSGKRILLIGGGNSVGETAAAVALQLSSARHSPNGSSQDIHKECKIIHVTPRPVYALPPFVPGDATSTTFVPIDFSLFDLGKRPVNQPIIAGAGRVDKVRKDISHGLMQGMIGSDQSDLGAEALKVPSGEPRAAVYVALSEQYAEFVRDGTIEVVDGRVTSLEGVGGLTVSATVRRGEEDIKVDDIAAVIYATGYTPATALNFLPKEVKKALHFDSNSMRLPLILEQWQTMSPAVPDIAFVGFYEGPFWGVLEMQARLTAERWLNPNKLPATRQFEDAEKLLELRQAMHDRGLDVPQYWFGDYLGYVEEAAQELKLQRMNGNFQEREGLPSPARYLNSRDGEGESETTMFHLYQTWQDCKQRGKFVARAALRAMQGNWSIQRRIESATQIFSGTFDGTASFHPRLPTQDVTGRVFDLEYLYIESGSFTSANSNMQPMTATRRYVYRYSEARDELSVWFVKPDNQLEVDYLFHILDFVSPAEAKKEGSCVAKADHLCIDDMYWTEYRLPMKGISLHEFQIKHTVKGPAKDYVAMTKYERRKK